MHLISFHYCRCKRWHFLHLTDAELSGEVKKVAKITEFVGGRARIGLRSDPKARTSCPPTPGPHLSVPRLESLGAALRSIKSLRCPGSGTWTRKRRWPSLSVLAAGRRLRGQAAPGPGGGGGFGSAPRTPQGGEGRGGQGSPP